jgi:hypothetical protein
VDFPLTCFLSPPKTSDHPCHLITKCVGQLKHSYHIRRNRLRYRFYQYLLCTCRHASLIPTCETLCQPFFCRFESLLAHLPLWSWKTQLFFILCNMCHTQNFLSLFLVRICTVLPKHNRALCWVYKLTRSPFILVKHSIYHHCLLLLDFHKH